MTGERQVRDPAGVRKFSHPALWLQLLDGPGRSCRSTQQDDRVIFRRGFDRKIPLPAGRRGHIRAIAARAVASHGICALPELPAPSEALPLGSVERTQWREHGE